MHHDILFESNRFNLSEPKKHFINPNCYGEDLAAWLRSKLIERGVPTIEPGQEDWGWYIESKLDDSGYFIGIGGNADDSSADPNQGEWRIMVEKKRSLSEKLLRKNFLAADDPMFALLESIIRGEPDFTNIRQDR